MTANLWAYTYQHIAALLLLPHRRTSIPATSFAAQCDKFNNAPVWRTATMGSWGGRESKTTTCYYRRVYSKFLNLDLLDMKQIRKDACIQLMSSAKSKAISFLECGVTLVLVQQTESWKETTVLFKYIFYEISADLYNAINVHYMEKC